MSEANVIYTLDGVNSTKKCKIEDKMKHIYKKYSTKINKNSFIHSFKIIKINN